MGMSYHRSFIPEKKYMITLIRKAVDMGINLFDTAEAYGPYTNEVLVGEALSPVRKNIQICTKFRFNIQYNQLRTEQQTRTDKEGRRELFEEFEDRLNRFIISTSC
jgi:aryl-alcohol dehydrogenase-like predicted oxidoreductase